MKKLSVILGSGLMVGCLVGLMSVFLFAQTVVPSGGSFGLSNSKTCNLPAMGYFGFCKPVTGGPAQWTDDGSAYANVNLSGTPGPAGPPGAAGHQGPIGLTGPQGPAGALPGTFTCDITIAVGGKATLSNCK